MTVARLREEMTQREFLEWSAFFRWEHDELKKRQARAR